MVVSQFLVNSEGKGRCRREYTGRVGGKGEDISKIHLIDMSKK